MYIVIYSFLSYITYTYLVDRISILSSFVGLESRYSLFLVLRISCILRTITNSYLLALALTLERVYNIFAPYCSLLAGPGSSYIIYQCTIWYTSYSYSSSFSVLLPTAATYTIYIYGIRSKHYRRMQHMRQCLK